MVPVNPNGTNHAVGLRCVPTSARRVDLAHEPLAGYLNPAGHCSQTRRRFQSTSTAAADRPIAKRLSRPVGVHRIFCRESLHEFECRVVMLRAEASHCSRREDGARFGPVEDDHGGSSHALLALINVANYGRRDKPCVVSVAPHVHAFVASRARPLWTASLINLHKPPVVARLQLTLRDTYTTALTTTWHIVSVCVCSCLVFKKKLQATFAHAYRYRTLQIKNIHAYKQIIHTQ